MQTAEAALALGREVAAVPGRITDESAAGPNLLIRDGAAAVLGAEDVLGLLGGGDSRSGIGKRYAPNMAKPRCSETRAGTKALLAVRGEQPDRGHGRR
jgi:predicted Rossmann fold nucleotide-binding protein DprA/Smf involved in DNA uptake